MNDDFEQMSIEELDAELLALSQQKDFIRATMRQLTAIRDRKVAEQPTRNTQVVGVKFAQAKSEVENG